MADQPTIEGLLGPRPAEPPATIEGLLGDRPLTAASTDDMGRPELGSDPTFDAYVHQSSVGRVLGAFGQGLSQGWGGEGIWSPESEQAMQKAGIFNDVDKGQHDIVKAANEALIRPLAATLDAAYRASAGLFSGAQSAVRQAGIEVGQPKLGRDLAALPEAFPTGFPEAPHVPEAVPEPVPVPAASGPRGVLPQDFVSARDLNVIGPGGEAAWKGLTEAPVANDNAIKSAVQEAQEAAPEPGQAEAPPTPTTPPTIHDVARQIAPEAFQEYDALDAHRTALRDQISTAQQQLRTEAEAQAPHADEIADLQQRLEDTTPRLAKKYQARLDELIPERDAFLADDFKMAALTRDTPEIAQMREELQAADYRMRDLAPDVTAAYRQAAQQFPEEAAPAAPAPMPGAEPVAAPAAPEPPAQAAAPAAPEPAAAPPQPLAVPVTAEGAPVQPFSITHDVAQKLVAAGRPADEAAAAAEIVAAHYQARAERFDGAKGTAEDLYRAEAPDVRAGKQREPKQRALELAQATKRGKIRLDDGRAIITLFKDANASTFLHETGHAWLEELLRDAADERAPDGLKADATSVRQWLGADAGEIPTRAHEKFARGFERYMMEGVAPTKALARVFGQFKDWLTRIYQSVTALKSEITPDIRDVFDRMLTTNVDRSVVAADDREPPAAEPETRPAPPPRGAQTPFAKQPKEPMRLVSFLRKMGGVKDTGGDVAHILGGSKYRPGLISQYGMGMDDAALSAWEHGYFPEHGEERPSINDLLNAIEEDLKGNPRYSVHDADAVDAFNEARERNAEIDRLASEHGIDPKGLTREQFFDKVAESLSRDQMDAEQKSLADAAERHGYELAVEDREWDEHHGVAPDTVGESRSLEDLERERQQEDAAAKSRQRQGDNAGPGQAGGPAADGQGGVRQGGDGAEPSGRGDAEGSTGAAAKPAVERPRSPTDANATYERPDDLIDKAGNIRLDNLNTPEDVSQVIRDAAAENDDFLAARRGVISDAQVLDLADALGMDPNLLNLRQIGQAFNAEQIMAARKLLVASATAVRDAMAKAAEGGEAEVMAYAQAKARHLMIQEQVSGVTAEAGRALRAFRNIDGMQEAEALGEFLKQQTGKTLFQMQEEAKLGARLETPQQVSRFVQDMEKSRYERGKEIVLSYFINNLISGPLTHAAYSIGNTTFALFKATAETATQATVGAAREALAGKPIDRVYFGEVGAQLYGMARGFRDGLKPGMEALRTGAAVLPGDAQGVLSIAANNVRQQVIPGRVGYVLETPSRAVSAIHTVFYTMAYEQEIARQAFRAAAKAGGDVDATIARLTQSPTPEMIEAAHTGALEQVLMNRPKFDSAQYHLSQLVNGNFFAKLVMPFMQIGMNILDQGIVQRTALSMLSSEARAEAMGLRGGAARDIRMGKIAVGSMLGIATVSLAAEGLITGGGPSDPNQRRIKEDSGWKAYSIRWGDTYIPYRKFLGPLGPLVSLSADAYEIRHAADDKGIAAAAASALFGFSEVVADETWMAGLSSFIDAARNWDTKGEQYLRNMASSFIPFSVGVGQVAREIDPYMRQGRTTVDAFRNKIPGLSEMNEPQIGVWGQPIASHTMLSPSTVNGDPVDARLSALDLGIAPVERKIRGIDLTPQQYTSFATQAGRMSKLRLDAIVNAPGFTALPAGEQTRAIKDTIEHAREAARTMVIMQSVGGPNDIMRKAVENKRKLLQ